ncbi:hypothetical protein AB0K86_06140 [Streptomyces clavifer]|uniref:hypothetical protein n=1 Tax=Streptomyces TaxID=1883 RepID=UPI000B05D02C|nr:MULTISPECIES: hypothetical protein [unclassified Streptomyces]
MPTPLDMPQRGFPNIRAVLESTVATLAERVRVEPTNANVSRLLDVTRELSMYLQSSAAVRNSRRG